MKKEVNSVSSEGVVSATTQENEKAFYPLLDAKAFYEKEYDEYLNYVDEVAQWVEYYMTRQGDKNPQFLIEDVEKHQISKDEAKTLTNYLYVEKLYRVNNIDR